jgi:hypothetical protein
MMTLYDVSVPRRYRVFFEHVDRTRLHRRGDQRASQDIIFLGSAAGNTS